MSGISGDGQVVAFTTHADSLSGQAGGMRWLVRKDMRTGALQNVTDIDPATHGFSSISRGIAINTDGSAIAFVNGAIGGQGPLRKGSCCGAPRPAGRGRSPRWRRAPLVLRAARVRVSPRSAATARRCSFDSLALVPSDTNHQRDVYAYTR